jgi:C4-dicarboxylate-specific signal transduction histidine kinase
MRPRQSKTQQLLKFMDSLESDVATKSGPKRPRRRRLRRATYAAGGLALLTAASAGISSLRDRLET